MIAYRTGHNSGLARKSAGSTRLTHFGSDLKDLGFQSRSLHRRSPFPFTLSQSLRFRHSASPIILATPSPPLQTPWDRESMSQFRPPVLLRLVSHSSPLLFLQLSFVSWRLDQTDTQTCSESKPPALLSHSSYSRALPIRDFDSLWVREPVSGLR
nr:hypothetical protein Itr_chr07CG09560 [Ipomoea trifida]